MSVPLSWGDSTGRTGILPVLPLPSEDQPSEPYYVCPHVFVYRVTLPGTADTPVRLNKLIAHGVRICSRGKKIGLGLDNDCEDKMGWRTGVSAIPG
jgi:hypothetical protein